MLRVHTLPGSLLRVLDPFRPCFTTPTFTTVVTLLAGMIARPAQRSVCGMLAGAGLAGVWHHSRGYDGSLKVFKGNQKLSRGNTFVVAAVVVMLPFLDRPVALPVLVRLWRKDRTGRSVGVPGGGAARGPGPGR